MLYNNAGVVPEASYEVPFGQARVLRDGSDITIVGISHAVVECLRASAVLEEVGVSAEVMDPVTLAPLDIDKIVQSVERTGRLFVVDNGWLNCGASSEIITQVIERTQGSSDVRVKRTGYAPTPCPTTKPLENAFYPDARSIALDAYHFVRGGDADMSWQPTIQEAKEIVEFKGPF